MGRAQEFKKKYASVIIKRFCLRTGAIKDDSCFQSPPRKKLANFFYE